MNLFKYHSPQPKRTKKYTVIMKKGDEIISILAHELLLRVQDGPDGYVWLSFVDVGNQTVALVRSVEVDHVISEAI